MKALASVSELESGSFRSFMAWLNAFAQVHGLRVHTSWSKVWEYPWVWRHISDLPLHGLKVLDIGSELSPFPWFLASLGASVWIVEKDLTFAGAWERVKSEGQFPVEWKEVDGATLPFADDFFDLVLSFSVLEHIPEKGRAIAEAARVLKPSGRLALTFDICELNRGMSYPAWGGEPLNMAEFDSWIWQHPQLDPIDPSASWNTGDLTDFVKWNLQAAPHHNYAVGGAVFVKRPRRVVSSVRKHRVHVLDTGLCSGNIGDDAMYLGAAACLPPDLDLAFEVHDRQKAAQSGLERALDWRDVDAVRMSLLSSDAVLILTDTPVMEDWGLDWPLRSNAWKLDCCHRAGIPVHAAGIGVDLLRTPEALDIFKKSYLPISSWTVRSPQCRAALLEMGVPAERVSVGADWVWLAGLKPDARAGEEWRTINETDSSVRRVGVNLVGEIWAGNAARTRSWAQVLDRLSQEYGAHCFFFCNEPRSGDYYDAAIAGQVMGCMRTPATLVPNLCYHPAGMVAMLSTMDLTVSLRYHFTTFSLSAGVPCLSVARGQKMQSLNAELNLPFVGDAYQPAEKELLTEAGKAFADPRDYLRPAIIAANGLTIRARNNLALFHYSLNANRR